MKHRDITPSTEKNGKSRLKSQSKRNNYLSLQNARKHVFES